MLDWVLYSEFAGKFDHLKDGRNNLSKLSSRSLQRDGVSNEKEGEKIVLSGLVEERVGSKEGFRFKSLDSFDGTYQVEDITYKLNEFVRWRNNICKIKMLFQVGDISWAIVEKYCSTRTDTLTNFTVVENTEEKEEETVLLNELSPPVVVAEEDNSLWILGCVSLDFNWLNNHVKK